MLIRDLVGGGTGIEVGTSLGSAPRLTTSAKETSMTSIPEERPRRRLLLPAFINGGLGLLFLVSALNRPTIANMRRIDLVHLLATGALLGMALVTAVLYFVGRRKG